MMDVFVPKSGAVVDLIGLKSIEKISSVCLDGYLQTGWSKTASLILDGLEPSGKRPKKGPPGIMQFSLQNFTISPGKAVLPTENSPNNSYVVEIKEPQVIQLEEPNSSKVMRGLIMRFHQRRRSEEGREFASEVLSPVVDVIPYDLVDKSKMVVLARELAPSIWATDVQRLFHPEHVVVQSIVQFFDHLEDVIWNSDRHGQAWQVQTLGREWKTYQTKASVSVTAARMVLSARPSTTPDRVRCLTNLHWQLQRTVDDAAKALEKWMGVVEAAGEYTGFFSAAPNWDQVD